MIYDQSYGKCTKEIFLWIQAYLILFKDAIARRALRIMSSLRSTSCLTASCLGLKLMVLWRGSTKESNTESP